MDTDESVPRHAHVLDDTRDIGVDDVPHARNLGDHTDGRDAAELDDSSPPARFLVLARGDSQPENCRTS